MAKISKKSAKKAGRPPKTGEKMEEIFRFMVAPTVGERYRNAASAAGLDLSEWIRRACDAAAANGLPGAPS